MAESKIATKAAAWPKFEKVFGVNNALQRNKTYFLVGAYSPLKSLIGLDWIESGYTFPVRVEPGLYVSFDKNSSELPSFDGDLLHIPAVQGTYSGVAPRGPKDVGKNTFAKVGVDVDEVIDAIIDKLHDESFERVFVDPLEAVRPLEYDAIAKLAFALEAEELTSLVNYNITDEKIMTQLGLIGQGVLNLREDDEARKVNRGRLLEIYKMRGSMPLSIRGAAVAYENGFEMVPIPL